MQDGGKTLFQGDARTPKTLRKADFARLVGVTPARVSHWVAKGLPVAATGRVNVEDGQKWIEENVDQARRETWKHASEADPPEVPKFRFAQIIHSSPATVSRYVKAGLPVEPNGRINVEKGWQWVRAKKDGEDLAGVGLDGHRMLPSNAAQASAAPMTARGQRDVAEAKISELKAERLAGRLIDAKATLRAVEGRARFERDAWIGWVNRAAPVLASEAGADMATIVAILDREVRAHLAALSVQPLKLPE